jgi:hypothetical protein
MVRVGETPHILNLGSECRCAVKFMPRPPCVRWACLTLVRTCTEDKNTSNTLTELSQLQVTASKTEGTKHRDLTVFSRQHRKSSAAVRKLNSWGTKHKGHTQFHAPTQARCNQQVFKSNVLDASETLDDLTKKKRAKRTVAGQRVLCEVWTRAEKTATQQVCNTTQHNQMAALRHVKRARVKKRANRVAGQ